MSIIYRILCLFAAIVFVQSVSAQDLAHRIPADAIGVVRINTPRLFDHVGVEEFSQSALGTVIVHFLDDSVDLKQVNLTDYGIALDRSTYMYAVHTDSVNYTTFLWPIADVTKLESTRFAGKEVVDINGYKQYLDTPDNSYGNTTVYFWSDDLLAVTTVDEVSGYFDNEEVAGRYGIGNKGYYDFYEEFEGDAIEGRADYWDNPNYWEDIEAEADSISGDRSADSMGMGNDTALVAPDTTEREYEEWSTDPFGWDSGDTTDTGYDGESYTDWYKLYDEAYARDQFIKDSVMTTWASAYATAILSADAATSIVDNAGYLAALDDKALASAWIPDFTSFYAFIWPEMFNIWTGSTEAFQYYGAMSVNVFADKNLRIVSNMEVAENQARSLKRMYDRKINRRFFRYVDSDQMLGMYGFSLSTKALLEELPVLLKEAYGGIMGPYGPHRADLGFAADMVSLLLDEEAVSRVVKGDGLFVLNGLEEQEVPFTHYDWDEDYNWIEVDSVKNELIPDFLFMLSSDDKGTYDRVVSYLGAKGLVNSSGRIVEVKTNDMPFGVYLTHHKGILFIGTALDKLEAIVDNQYRSKMHRNHKRLLRRNVVAGLFSVTNAVDEFDNEQLNTLDRYLSVRKLFGDLGDMQYTSRMRGNNMIHEFESHTPSEYPNAIYQLMYLVDYAMRTF